MRNRRLVGLAITAALCAAVIPFATSAQAEGPECEWLAGDFHVHTVYSHDTYGGPGDTNTGPDEFYTLGWTPGQQGTIAESRDLDFIAITDHDNVMAQQDKAASGWGGDTLPGENPLIWVPDYENTVSGPGGHAQMHGATPEHFDEYEASTVQGPEAAAELIRRDGGAFQINHPADMDWHEDDGSYSFPGFAPDALELWNIGAWFYQPPAPATNDHEFPVSMYNDFLDDGFHVAATGGSDTHWRATTSVQGVGQPTTWVCAEDRTAQAIIEGVRANRTRISHQPPAYMGAEAQLFADGDGNGTFEAMLGDTVAPGSTLQAVIKNAEGATLRLVSNGGEAILEETIDDFEYATTIDVPLDSSWVRAEVFFEDGQDQRADQQEMCELSQQFYGRVSDERNFYCENRLAMLAMTSPIYFAEDSFDPATTLTYVGDTTVKQNSDATFAATLTDSAGSPLAGQAISFTFRGVTMGATTDEAGRASVQTRVSHPRGTDVVHVDFAGTDTYDPSHIEQIITITNGRG